MTIAKNSTAIVLGAGLMGRLLACALAQRGHRVEVFDAAGPLAENAAARVAAATALNADSSRSHVLYLARASETVAAYNELLGR